MSKRTRDASSILKDDQSFQCPLALISEHLHTSRAETCADGGYLPCRTTEADALVSGINEHLKAGSGGSIYVCGSPGVGKTAVVVSASACFTEMTRTCKGLPLQPIKTAAAIQPNVPKTRIQGNCFPGSVICEKAILLLNAMVGI